MYITLDILLLHAYDNAVECNITSFLWETKKSCNSLYCNIHFIVVVNPRYCQDLPILNILPNGLLFFFWFSLLYLASFSISMNTVHWL